MSHKDYVMLRNFMYEVAERRGHILPGKLERSFKFKGDDVIIILKGKCVLCGYNIQLSSHKIKGEFIRGKAFRKNCRKGSAKIYPFEYNNIWYGKSIKEHHEHTQGIMEVLNRKYGLPTC